MNESLFAHTQGPHNARVVIVGEAWGQQEELTGLPFQGASGQELTQMLSEGGILRRDCLLCNVFNSRPPGNNIEEYFDAKTAAGLGGVAEPPLRLGKYIKECHLPELERLRSLLSLVRPNLIIALGNTACWAVLGTAKIGSLRGAVRYDSRGFKVLPTYHPAAVLRQWALRPIVIADFMKASRERAFPDVRRPERTVTVNPTFDEVRNFCSQDHSILSVDIETARGTITEIGFAARRNYGLVVPLVISNSWESYWPNVETEAKVWTLIKEMLEKPMLKLFQNGLYDLQYICKMGIRPRNCAADTMLLHHALFPELQKGLGFLGSIYTDEPAWKLMRTAKQDTVKADE
jgi:DNA polymerase